MDLRERTVYLRLSTWEDLFNDGRAEAFVESVEALTGTSFVASQDLGSSRRQRPGRARAGLAGLRDYCGRGLHIGARVRLFSDDPSVIGQQQLTLSSGGHPYTGRYRTALDLRIPSVFFESAEFLESFCGFVEGSALELCPFQAHAHATDDSNAQNMASPRLLRAGFGLDPSEFDFGSPPPSLEISRGEHRYLASWLVVLGPALVDEIGLERINDVPFHKRELAPKLYLLRLFQSPLRLDAAARSSQQSFWKALELEALVERKNWAMGYWDHEGVRKLKLG